MIRSLARLTAAALILAATTAFAIGVVLERHSEAAEHAAKQPPTATSPAAPGAAATRGDTDTDSDADQDADQGAGTDADRGHEGNPTAETAERSELVFGLNLESPALVTAAVVVSVLLAIAILATAPPWLAALTAAVMLAFTVLDIREIVHQLGRSHTELAAIALLAALLHLLATITAAHVTRTGHAHTSTTAIWPRPHREGEPASND